jgi:hypothetical protein
MIHGWFPVVLFWVTVAVCAIPAVHRRDVPHEFASRIPIGIVFAVLLFAGSPHPGDPHRRPGPCPLG